MEKECCFANTTANFYLNFVENILTTKCDDTKRRNSNIA